MIDEIFKTNAAMLNNINDMSKRNEDLSRTNTELLQRLLRSSENQIENQKINYNLYSKSIIRFSGEKGLLHEFLDNIKFCEKDCRSENGEEGVK